MRFFTTVVGAAVAAIALPAQAAEPVGKCIEAKTKQYCGSYPRSWPCREGHTPAPVIAACRGK
ncbi:MAG: hypothetical protein FWD12_10030 [Alphaproteobacteria bacterium]|nr:hypothetical protein [Alphaproteobacteria bacterium]